jgi:hypothetical protein
MDWNNLLAFIREKDPSYLGAVRGVPRAEIAQCEANCALTLPTFYVDFIATMGAEAGSFEPFGAMEIWHFRELLDELPAESYPQEQLFKVSINDDPGAISPLDKFIELRRSDGSDAPLVLFEDGGPFSWRAVVKSGYSLAEWLATRVFDFFELDRRPHTTSLCVIFETAREMRENRPAALDMLTKMGFVPALPSYRATAWLRRPSCSARLRELDELDGLSIKIGAESRRELDVIIEQLRDRFPFLTTSEPER